MVDNGIGFEADKCLKEPRPDSYGLLGMKERLMSWADISIKSYLGGGTGILAILVRLIRKIDMSENIKVVIVDDHPLVRACAKSWNWKKRSK